MHAWFGSDLQVHCISVLAGEININIGEHRTKGNSHGPNLHTHITVIQSDRK